MFATAAAVKRPPSTAALGCRGPLESVHCPPRHARRASSRQNLFSGQDLLHTSLREMTSGSRPNDVLTVGPASGRRSTSCWRWRKGAPAGARSAASSSKTLGRSGRRRGRARGTGRASATCPIHSCVIMSVLSHTRPIAHRAAVRRRHGRCLLARQAARCLPPAEDTSTLVPCVIMYSFI